MALKCLDICDTLQAHFQNQTKKKYVSTGETTIPIQLQSEKHFLSVCMPLWGSSERRVVCSACVTATYYWRWTINSDCQLAYQQPLYFCCVKIDSPFFLSVAALRQTFSCLCRETDDGEHNANSHLAHVFNLFAESCFSCPSSFHSMRLGPYWLRGIRNRIHFH